MSALTTEAIVERIDEALEEREREIAHLTGALAALAGETKRPDAPKRPAKRKAETPTRVIKRRNRKVGPRMQRVLDVIRSDDSGVSTARIRAVTGLGSDSYRIAKVLAARGYIEGSNSGWTAKA